MAKATTKKDSSAQQIDETANPSKPVTLEELMNPLGNSGVFLVNGFLEQDYNAKLAGKLGLDVYDKMRKSDASVKSLLQVTTLPLRSTEWFVEPGKNEEGKVGPEEQEIADFVHRALFEKMEQGWDDYLREVLTCLVFGFSVFEKVYMQDDEHVWLKSLAFRRQKTIYRWEQSDGTAGVTQITPSGALQQDGSRKYTIDIPAAKLLIFTHQREGSNYEGESMLRPAYKHYYIKDQLYKFDSVRHERQSVGVPYIKLPDGCSTDDYNKAKAILRNFRAHEMTGLVMPDPKWEFGFVDLKAGDVSDLWKSIEHHNREILKSGLAQFLELGGGASKSGSRAVSTDQSGLFIQAIDAVAKMIDDVHSRFLIPELVDYNFDNVYRYPRLQHRRLEKTDLPAMAGVMQTLTAAGILTVDKELEEWARKTFDLPPKIEEETDPTLDEPQDETPEEEVPLGDAAPEQGVDPATGEPMTDDEGNPVAQDGSPMAPSIEPLGEGDVSPDQMPPDASAPTDDLTPEQEAEADTDGDGEVSPEELQAEIDKIDKQLKPNKKAQFYEFGGAIFAEIEGNWYSTDGLKFAGPLSDETKKKISDALKARNPGSPQQPVKKVNNLAQRAGQLLQQNAAAQKPVSAQAIKARGNLTVNQRHTQALQQKTPAKPAAPAVPAQAQRVSQQQQDPHSPLYKGPKSAAVAAKPAPKAAAKGKTAKAQPAAASTPSKGKAAKVPPELKAKGNARDKLKSIRAFMNTPGRSPAEKQQARDALVTLQKSLAPKLQKEQAHQVKRAQVVVKKQAAALKKAKKSAGGHKAHATKLKHKLTAKVTPAKKVVPAKPAVKPIVKAAEVDADHHSMHETMQQYSELYDGEMVLAAQRAIPVQAFDEKPKWRTFKFAEPYKSWRTMTFAEEKVNLSGLKKALQTAGAKLVTKVDDITEAQKADILAQVKRAVENNDIAAVGQIRAKYTGDLSAAIVDVQKQMFEQGMRSATQEMGVKMPPTAQEVKAAMRVQSDRIVDKLTGDMEDAASNAVTQVAAKNAGSITNTGTTEAINAASQAIDSVLAQKAALHTLSVIGSLNLGRSAIFERYPEQVYAFQYSAIIDDVTTDLCLSLDGRVVEPGSDDYIDFTPPQHFNCRSIWVEILQDEEFKPDIDGIPGSIEPNATIDDAEDLEAPVVKANSPAIKLLKAELEDRTDKLKQYQDAGLYPNRQDAHQERIDALKGALKGAGVDVEDDGE